MLRFALPALAGFVLSAAAARADEPKPAAVDLADLKAALAAAQKRGDNVDAVAEALAALEKVLGKGAKPGEAPPELTALREAVEAAARKGENVEAVAKELGRVEKALTGREYQRPAPPEPKAEPEPVPQFRPPARGRPGFGNRVVIVAGNGNFDRVAMTMTNGRFVIQARKGDLTYVISGQAGVADSLRISVRDGEKRFSAEEVKKLPAQYRPAVEELLKMVQK
jgi:hypothetical protein